MTRRPPDPINEAGKELHVRNGSPISRQVDEKHAARARRMTVVRSTKPSQPGRDVEPSSWWPFVSFIFGAVASYAVLVVHLVLEATTSNPWMLSWMAVPAALFCASGAALFVGSNLSPRERLAAAPAALLGYSSRTKER
jgi:hypothetical protein